MAYFSEVPQSRPRSTVSTSWEKKTYRCTPPSTLDTFGEKSRAWSASVNEIAGLLKKKKNEEYDDAESWKSVWPDSRTPNWKQVGAGWDNVRLDMTPKPITCEFESLARFTLVVRRLFVRWWRHFHTSHPYIRVSTDALIWTTDTQIQGTAL